MLTLGWKVQAVIVHLHGESYSVCGGPDLVWCMGVQNAVSLDAVDQLARRLIGCCHELCFIRDCYSWVRGKRLELLVSCFLIGVLEIENCSNFVIVLELQCAGVDYAGKAAVECKGGLVDSSEGIALHAHRELSGQQMT